jgi:hypothetical protein
MAEKLSLGGREYVYVGADGPLRQDLFLLANARHAGLAGVFIAEGETPEAFAQRLLDSCITSGRALRILSALIVPAGVKPEAWNEEDAYKVECALAAIVDPAEKTRVLTELLSAILGFFENGLGPWIASVRASSVRNAGASSPSPNSIRGTASGETSSDSLPATTST